jgi:AP-1 complex subunit gamma-1
MSSRLRDLIRSIRECKTAAEERAVVAKESAYLRDSFKKEDVSHRHRNIAKLMFLHMLGYPTHFGQMECLKLIARPSFAEKRIGYLGLMALLDEKQEILMLVTNSIQQDLSAKNQYTIGLALCALGNICSAEMARDLIPDVKRLMGSRTIYLKKKSAICAVRLAQKAPELILDLKDSALALLDERSHGVLLGAVTLALELCKLDKEAVDWFRKKVHNLIKMLKSLTTSGMGSKDHHVRGVPDPFLQVQILHLLRLLGKGSAELSDVMSDVLAQVASNTDSSKNAGCAVLYECALTIIEIESSGGLKVLAVNILGKFLGHRDNNMKYVALDTLIKVVAIDPKAVQRHKNVIVQCVQDADISIRKRALDLACALVNENNIDVFMEVLLQFMEDSEVAFRPKLVEKICTLVESFAPSPQWYVDTMVDVLEKGGAYVQDRAARAFLVMISATDGVQGYAVRKLFRALFDNLDQSSSNLLIVSLWCIGEFGGKLLSDEAMMKGEIPLKASDTEILSLIEQVMKGAANSGEVMEYALTSLIKLSERYPGRQERIQNMIAKYKQSSFVELQQRACEFDRLFKHSEKIRGQLLEQMPSLLSGDDVDQDDDGGVQQPEQPAASDAAGGGLFAGGDLLDLDVGVGESSSSPVDALADLLGDTSVGISPQAAQPPPQDGNAMLMDMLGGGGVSVTPTTTTTTGSSGSNPLDDLLGGVVDPMQQTPVASSVPSIVVYEKNGVTIDFSFTNSGSAGATTIKGLYRNTSPSTVSGFVVQAAVPKYIQLRLEPASGNQLPPLGSGSVQQQMHVVNSLVGQKPLMMRLKIGYSCNGNAVSDMVEVKNFPTGL